MSNISRRTIAKGAAWSVPVIAVGAAAPAYATSGSGPTGVFLNACKQPGASCENDYGFIKGYTFTVSISNPSPIDLYVYPQTGNGTSWDLGAIDPILNLVSIPAKNFSYNTARLFTGGAIGAPLPTALLIPAGGSVTIIFNAGVNGNSSNIEAAGALFMAWGHTLTPGADTDHPYVPSPTSEGWFTIPIAFPSTPPCGTDCGPGGDTTET